MEFKLVVDDTLIARARQFFRRGGIVLMALLMAVPLLLLARSAMNEYGLTVFEAGKVISSSEVNENFNVLAQQSDALQSSVDSLEAAITVDGNNNVGIGSTSPSANLDVKGNLSKALSGTVTVGGGKTEVSGTKTKFFTELAVGNAIRIGGEVFTVGSITDDFKLALDSAHQAGALNAVAYTDSDLLSIQNGDGVGKMVVNKSGNVGMGTMSPENKLHLSAATGVALTLDDTSTAQRFNVVNSGRNFYIDNITTSSKPFLISSSGNVGIGTIAPSYPLHVVGETYSDAGFRVASGLGDSVNSAPWYGLGSSDYSLGYPQNVVQVAGYGGIALKTAQGDMVMLGGGNVGIGTTAPAYKLDVNGQIRASNVSVSSDIRLKRDIRPITHALEGIQCLQGVTYYLRDPLEDQALQLGFIAQEVERCYPEVVTTDDLGYKSVAYDRLVAPLIEALKAQQQTLELQEVRIQRLEAHLTTNRTERSSQGHHHRN